MKMRLNAILLLCFISLKAYSNQVVDMDKNTTACLQINIPIEYDEGSGGTGNLRLLLRSSSLKQGQQVILSKVYRNESNLYAINYINATKQNSALIYKSENDLYFILNLRKYLEDTGLFNGSGKIESVFIDSKSNKLLEINVKYMGSEKRKKLCLLSHDGLKLCDSEGVNLKSLIDFPLRLNAEMQHRQDNGIDLKKSQKFSEGRTVSSFELKMRALESIDIIACFDYQGIDNSTVENKEKSLLALNMKSCTTHREPYLMGKGTDGAFFLMIDFADHMSEVIGDKQEIYDQFVNIDEMDGNFIKCYSKIFAPTGKRYKKANYLMKLARWNKLEYISSNVQSIDF